MRLSRYHRQIEDLYRYLRDSYESGTKATYAEMAGIIGFDSISASSYSLRLALKQASEDGMNFCNDSGVGYRPLKNAA